MVLAARFFRIERYKLCHSPLLLVHLFIPLAGMAMMLTYYAISPWNESMRVSAYLQILSMAFPVIIGVVTSMTAEREARAGVFQMQLCAPCHKCIPHIASSLVLLLFGFFSTVIAVCGFGALFRLMGYTAFSPVFYVKAAVLLFLGGSPLYLLHYLVGFQFGKGACLGLGIVGSLLSALLLTGLGDKIWMFLPWGISIRFVSVLAAYPNEPFFNSPEVGNALCFLAVSSVALMLIMVFWSKEWEGRHCEED